MKKLLVVLLSIGLILSASAQPKIGGGIRGGGSIGGGGVHYVRPRVTVIAPYTYVSSYYGLGSGFGYSPFYNPYYAYPRYEARPSQLDLQIDDIKNDFSYRISTVKHDKSLAKDERKQKVRDLKHEREEAIIEAKKNYYAQRENDRAS